MSKPDAFRTITTVAGLSFHEYKRLQDRLTVPVAIRTPNKHLELRPVRDNAFDPNAVEVWFTSEDDSGQLGFIPMKISKDVTAAIDLYDHCEITIIDHDRLKDYKNRLTIGIYCFNEPSDEDYVEDIEE